MTEPGCARTGRRKGLQTSYPLAERTDEAIERHWREMVEHRAPLQTTQSDGMCFLGRQKPMMDNRGHADWRTAPVKRTVQLVILFLLFALYGLAWADYFNGHDLVKHMNSADRHDVAMFRGYIAGVQDVYNGEVFLRPRSRQTEPSGIRRCQYLTAHPSLRHLLVKQLVMNALVDAFPCKKK